MTTIIIGLILYVTYFIITSIKEREATEKIDIERKINNNKIANIHFNNMVEQELIRQKNIEEIKKLFTQQLESNEEIHKVAFEDDKILITTEFDVDKLEATDYAKMLINTLIPSTGINEVKVYKKDGFICGSASRDDNKESQHVRNSTGYSDKEISNPDKMKFKISSMFYDFCFSKKTAKLFLENNSMSKYIRTGFILYRFENETILEKILKDFLKHKYGFDLGKSSFNFYRQDGYKFYIDVSRFDVEETNSHFEILNNDFEDVKNEDGFPMAIAKEFIVYCERNVPKSIFILVYDPIINRKVLRRLYENGKSKKLIFVDKDDETDGFNYLKEYVKENKL